MRLGDRGDLNNPQLVVVPKWGPDGVSRRMAVANSARANPSSPASIGIGVRPAPRGASESERSKTNAPLPPQQSFRGVVIPFATPALITSKPVSSFPSANTQVNPVLLAMSIPQVTRRSFT